MSRSADIVAQLGGEDRAFRLAIGEWRRIQEKCDAGPGEILARLAPAFVALQQGMTAQQLIGAGFLGRWRIDDVREPILQGLIGAGMTPAEAALLVKQWVDDRPLLEGVAVAYEVVLASITGADDEQPAGERQAAAGQA